MKMGVTRSFQGFLTVVMFLLVPVHVFDAEKACTKVNPFPSWPRHSGSGQRHHPLCYRESPHHHSPEEDNESGRENQRISASEFTCVKTDGIEPPHDLTSFTTSLLHERDVTHYMTWDGYFWTLGSGAYAEVHLGRLWPRGECVVVKRFLDSPLRTIEREIHIHRYIEQVLPSTPRLLGLLPIGPHLRNASLVYQLVHDSYSLHDWLKLKNGLSTIQWLSVALQLAVAMETMHRKCVLHNDLHSSNILLHFQQESQNDPDCGISRLEKKEDDFLTNMHRSLAKVKVSVQSLPKVTLIDFGHATFRKGKVYKVSEKSLKSCRHLAPEIVRHKATSPASDVYSLGHEFLHIAKVINSSRLKDLAQQCKELVPETRPSPAEVTHRLRGMFMNECRRQNVLLKEDSANMNGLWSIDFSGHSLHQHLHSSLMPCAVSAHDPQPSSHPQCLSSKMPHHNPKSLPENHATEFGCLPQLERAMSKITLPYITFNGDLAFETVGRMFAKFFESERTIIFNGWFGSTGEKVVIKELKTSVDYYPIRYEAMVNAYLNQTGWVPTFYGVVPLNKYDFNGLGIVQEMFAEGVTLEEVLQSRRPFGIGARVDLAHQLTSLLHDVHSRHMLINNFKTHNILCQCVNNSDCSHIRVIDLGEMTGCEGKRFKADENQLRYFLYLAPEVRQNQLTSFQSDVYSLCVVLDAVLEEEAILFESRDDITTHNKRDNSTGTKKDSTTAGNSSDVKEVVQFFQIWKSIRRRCFSDSRHLRPRISELKHFFSSFLTNR